MNHPLQRNHTQQILSSREEEEEEEGPTFCERLENETEDSQHHAEHGREEETETDPDGFIQVERRRRGRWQQTIIGTSNERNETVQAGQRMA